MLRAPGPETSVDGDQVRILVPFVATQVTAQVMDRMPHLGVIGTGAIGRHVMQIAHGLAASVVDQDQGRCAPDVSP